MFSSPLTREGVDYAWNQLLTRAGIDPASMPVTMSYASSKSLSGAPTIIVEPCNPSAWDSILRRKPNSISWLPVSQVIPPGAALPFGDPIPVPFWGSNSQDGDKPFAELQSSKSILFHADIVAATMFMLSRWEETVVPIRDEHGRFPATASTAYKQGFLDRPIVDEYALILREWLKVLLPTWQPRPRAYSLKLSHDVDNIRRFRNAYTAVRTLGGDLLKRRSIRQAWRTILGTTCPEQDPYFAGLLLLAQISRENALGNDAFYFMATTPGPMESDYDLASRRVRRCIETLQKQGFEIGFHAGYYTFNDPARLAMEKARFAAIVGQTHFGGRQHFLRFEAPNTWRHWEQAGMMYDSTICYADHEGFRCGTCHPFRPFDMEKNRELDLWEQPLIIMENTLGDYRGLAPEGAETRILDLAQRCQYVEGTFTLLWHNSSLQGRWQSWAEMYHRVVGTLAGCDKHHASQSTDYEPG